VTGSPRTELIVCDTSFVGLSRRQQQSPKRFAHWSPAVLARIGRARLAVSLVTVAEVRVGFATGGLGPARVEREERRLASFGILPVADDVAMEYVRLRVASKSRGLNVGANDLWIAATAEAIEAPLVSCDADHDRLSDHLTELIYLPVAPPEAP
jgi:predicted nucleic acid-binding protein